MVFLVSLANTKPFFSNIPPRAERTSPPNTFAVGPLVLPRENYKCNVLQERRCTPAKRWKIESARSYLWVEQSVMLMLVNEYYSETYLVLRQTCTMDLFLRKLVA